MIAGDLPKDMNFENSKCPLEGKCSFYETIKNDPSKINECPVEGCPKYKEWHSKVSNFNVRNLDVHT